MWKMGGCIMYTGIRMLLLFVPLFFYFSFSPAFKHLKFSSHFSQEPGGLEDWNLVHTWTVGRCIMYTEIRLLVYTESCYCSYSSLYFFILLSLQFSNKIFVTLFAGTVRPRRLKLCTHVDSGQMYRVYRNQAAAAYSSLNFSFVFLLR